MKPLSPDRKKEIRHNLIAAAALEALYALLFFLFREQVSSYGYFQAAATLAGIGLVLHRLEPVYFYGTIGFAAFAQCGGAMFRLYDIIPVYDLLLHLASGILLTFAGHYLLVLLLRRHPQAELPRSVELAFSWLFAAASAGVWEIYEFTVDQLFGLDSQLGSLTDTMGDIIAGTIGGLLGLGLLTAYLKKRKKTN